MHSHCMKLFRAYTYTNHMCKYVRQQVAEDIVRVFEGALGSMRSSTASQQRSAAQRSQGREESEEDDADATVST
jgi:hypothetical protein